MNILCIGDIVSAAGRRMVSENLPALCRDKDISLVIANGENATHGRGMSARVYRELCGCGIDAFTMGNHVWGCKDIYALLEHKRNIVRPANMHRSCPGKGSTVITAKNGARVMLINLIGRTYMEPCDSPFDAADRELRHADADIVMVDFHAEATSEKQAMAWHLNGRVSAVFGTHTHVQTADETVLPKGTGYITDLGMTGAVYSILGMDRTIIKDRFINGMPQKFELADGKGQLCGGIFSVNADGTCTGAERVFIRE